MRGKQIYRKCIIILIIIITIFRMGWIMVNLDIIAVMN